MTQSSKNKYPYKVIPNDWEQFYAEQIQQQLPECLHTFYHEHLINGVSGQQTVEGTDFVAVDIETTGLDAQKDDIVSIGLVPFHHKRIYLAKAQYWVVRSQHLTSESVVVHQITHSEVADAPALSSVLPEVMKHLQGKQVVVHYRYMEREFFRAAVAEWLNENFLFPVIDTLELEAEDLRKKQSLMARFLKQRLPPLRLLNARERYNLPSYENHNALVDALATAELLQAQIAKQNLVKLPLKELWR